MSAHPPNFFLIIHVFKENVSTRISSKPNLPIQFHRQWEGELDRWKGRIPRLAPVGSLPLVCVGTKHIARPLTMNLLSSYRWSWGKRKEWELFLKAQRHLQEEPTYETDAARAPSTPGKGWPINPAFIWAFQILPSTQIQAITREWLGWHAEGNDSRPRSLLHGLKLDLHVVT